jgi:hypothetical protein
MECDAFSNTELPGVSHFQLPIDPGVINATISILTSPTPRDLCSGGSNLLPHAWLSVLHLFA